MSGPGAPTPQQPQPPQHPPPVDVAKLAKPLEKEELRILEGAAPVSTPLGAAVSIALILGLVGLAIAAFHYGTPTLGTPPNAPQSATEAVQLYEKTSAIYQAASRDRSAFVKDVLLVIAPALTALGGYMLGRQSKSG